MATNEIESADRNSFADPTRFLDRVILERRTEDPDPAEERDGRIWYDPLIQKYKYATPTAVEIFAVEPGDPGPPATPSIIYIMAADFGFDPAADPTTNANALNNALAAAAVSPFLARVMMNAGTFDIDDTIDPQYDSLLVGQGINRTVLKWVGAIDSVMMYAPGGQGSIGSFTLDGDNVAGVIGLLANDAHRPDCAVWDGLRITQCLGTGFLLSPATSGVSRNVFGNFWIDNCGDGISILPTATGFVNENHFGYISIIDSVNGIIVNDQGLGADGNIVEYGYLKGMSGIALNIINAILFIVEHGSLSNNVTDIFSGPSPDVEDFTFYGLLEGVPYLWPVPIIIIIPEVTAPIVLTPNTDTLTVDFGQDIGYDTYVITIEATAMLSTFAVVTKLSTGFTVLFANTIPANATALWSVKPYGL